MGQIYTCGGVTLDTSGGPYGARHFNRNWVAAPHTRRERESHDRDMRGGLKFQLGLYSRGMGREYKGLDEWKTPKTVALDRSLIRAAPSHRVLANFGGVFRSSSSTDDVYGMSRPVRRIDGFVSPHSWRDSRWLKFLALSYYFNAHRALAASWLAALFVFYLEDGGSAYLWPPRAVFDSIDGHTYGHSINPIIAATAVFLVTLGFGGARAMLFVDKCYISQADEERRAAGIQLIPEVLMRSRRLILLYEHDYFERLWCVFEWLFSRRTHHRAADAARPNAFAAFAPGHDARARGDPQRVAARRRDEPDVQVAARPDDITADVTHAVALRRLHRGPRH